MNHVLQQLVELCNQTSEKVASVDKSIQWDTFHEFRNRAERFERAWGRTWYGDFARIYYKDFQDPPDGETYFKTGIAGSQETSSDQNWRKYRAQDIVNSIENQLDLTHIDEAAHIAENLERGFVALRRQTISIVESLTTHHFSTALTELGRDISALKVRSYEEMLNEDKPSLGDLRPAKALLLGAEVTTPPHKRALAKSRWIQDVIEKYRNLLGLMEEAIQYMNISDSNPTTRHAGDRIFIGHGESLDWLLLEKFLVNDLKLKVDEFNRVTIGGVSTKERLQQMLSSSCFAFLVLTAEDEIAESESADDQDKTRKQARMNVIHEAGLFQGKLGFEYAIIMLENGCEEFSNIHGVGQIRFDKGKLRSTFHEVRRHLEDRGILPKPA